MSFAVWLERHRRSVLFVMFALGIAGLFATVSLPVGLFPVASFPRIRVISLDRRGAGAVRRGGSGDA